MIDGSDRVEYFEVLTLIIKHFHPVENLTLNQQRMIDIYAVTYPPDEPLLTF